MDGDSHSLCCGASLRDAICGGLPYSRGQVGTLFFGSGIKLPCRPMAQTELSPMLQLEVKEMNDEHVPVWRTTPDVRTGATRPGADRICCNRSQSRAASIPSRTLAVPYCCTGGQCNLASETRRVYGSITGFSQTPAVTLGIGRSGSAGPGGARPGWERYQDIGVDSLQRTGGRPSLSDGLRSLPGTDRTCAR